MIKELWEAGYPLVRIAQRDVQYYQHRQVVTFGNDRTYLVPLLEELIEACGTKFKRLRRKADGWWADSQRHQKLGESPSEAVARLWLALSPTPQNLQDSTDTSSDSK